MPRTALTDRFIAAAKADSTGRTDYFDEKMRGLALRVSGAGTKSWTYIFTSPRDEKRARLQVGTYPATSLAEARTRALEAKGAIEAGNDPRDLFAAREASALTVGMLVAHYLEQHVKINLRSAAEVERRLNKNVVPIIGSVKLADLHRRDVNRVIDPIVKRGKLVEANRVFEDMRAMFRWAVRRGDLDRNPMDGMKKPSTSQPRERVLSDDEIRILWTGLPAALKRSKNAQRIIRLLLVTGQRVGEVSGMHRDELDLRARTWMLPGSRTKNGHGHIVPLSDLALDIINEALAATNSPFLFPSEDDAEGDDHVTARAVARTIARANKPSEERPAGRFRLAHWTAHDLRRTALTGMAQLGVAPIVLGHVANHRTTTNAGVTLAVYTWYAYATEKRAALDAWAGRLTAIVRPTVVVAAAA